MPLGTQGQGSSLAPRKAEPAWGWGLSVSVWRSPFSFCLHFSLVSFSENWLSLLLWFIWRKPWPPCISQRRQKENKTFVLTPSMTFIEISAVYFRLDAKFLGESVCVFQLWVCWICSAQPSVAKSISRGPYLWTGSGGQGSWFTFLRNRGMLCTE